MIAEGASFGSSPGEEPPFEMFGGVGPEAPWLDFFPAL